MQGYKKHTLEVYKNVGPMMYILSWIEEIKLCQTVPSLAIDRWTYMKQPSLTACIPTEAPLSCTLTHTTSCSLNLSIPLTFATILLQAWLVFVPHRATATRRCEAKQMNPAWPLTALTLQTCRSHNWYFCWQLKTPIKINDINSTLSINMETMSNWQGWKTKH